MKIILILLCLSVSLPCISQIGGYVHVGFETFYNWNTIYSGGLAWKDHKLGVFHQQAKSNDEFTYIRQGIWGEVFIGKALEYDDINLKFYGGFRLAQSNDDFVGFTPHGTLAWTIGKNVEIPFTFSIYSSRMVMSVGLRVVFRRTAKDKVQNSPRKSLQPTTLDPNY